jgi:hypothetical protein
VASLKHKSRGLVRPLSARTVVGRSFACNLRLSESHTSGEHATLVWTSEGTWEIRDLGSKNGTFVDGARIEPARPIVLARGSTVAFGDPEDAWALADDGAPGLIAVDLTDGAARGASDGILALPDDDDPELSIYESPAGSWVGEDADGELRPVLDQGVVQAGGRPWRIQLPVMIEGTPLVDDGPTVETLALRMAVSQDEERVEIRILHRGREILLEPREHGYILLTLARLRLEEADRPEGERGWIDRDELLRMLRLDANAFNVAVHRARHQFLNAGVRGAAGIVQVRRRQRRFGIDRVEIVPI